MDYNKLILIEQPSTKTVTILIGMQGSQSQKESERKNKKKNLKTLVV